MSNQEFDEFEVDEERLEARRQKRLEMKRKRKMQQRIILSILAVVLILVIVLIVKSCGGPKEEEKPDPITPPPQEEVVEPPANPDVKATLAAVGDIMMYDAQLEDAKIDDTTYDFTKCFKAISPYTQSADLTVGNLELNFLGYAPYSGKPREQPYFNSPEILATNLADIGFDILQTANTYSIMSGLDGLQSTISILDQAGIDHLGTHATDPAQSGSGGVVIREVNGIKFAFIGFTKGVNNMKVPANNPYAVDLLYTDYYTDYKNIDMTAIMNRIDAAKKHEPDVIVAMLHWGSEYDLDVSETQQDIQDLMFKSGVDVILGSHSHLVGPMKMVDVETTEGEKKQCFVAYSLGNFISYQPDHENTENSAILNLEFTKSGETGDTTISGADYTPLYILDRGEGAETRFEVLPIRNAIKSSMFEEYEDKMTAAIDKLKQQTQSELDSGK